ncbi:MAG: TM2 domain-containing protein [Oscillospiraceae bacterium]|nr:TM2 domain-containing protein [Oscillospiraceae bacterium]
MKSRTTAGVLAILLGSIGAHKFYLGYTKEGLTMLLIGVIGGLLSLGIIAGVIAIIALVEGIIYLTMPEEQWQSTYVYGHKGWF